MWGKVFKRRGHGPGARDGADGTEARELEARVVAFGEALRAHPFTPDTDPSTRRELGRALDAYDEATKALNSRDDSGAPDEDGVLRALDGGRLALDRLDARLAGRPLPEQLPLCFFDARHGPGTTRVRWPPSRSGRMVAACAADAVQVREGREPLMSRRVREALTSERPGRGTTSHQVELPRERPSVLVVRTDQATRVEVRFEDKVGRSSRFYPLGGGVDPVIARVPAPGKRRTLKFTVAFPDGDEIKWTADAESAHAVPIVGDDGMRGDGSDVIRFEGAAEGWRLRHRGNGPVALEALDDDLAFWTRVASGDGDVDLEFRWPGPGYYQVRAGGTWLLEPAGAS
ncbi:hypothetical protein [Actinomadura oligospora]|uniref:hypothetical protein n=1 Tax=Actinomadura oligospora TaxID=111804 RepID=UPI00047DF467|nr:hypothetical protein [Actinomadura oligospora]